MDTSRAWLAGHQSIPMVARDRGGGYREVIAKALLDAEQVVDRWHLMENSSRAFLDAGGKSIRQIRQAVGNNVVDPKFLTYAEKLQCEGYLRRQETNEAIRELSKKGASIRQIVRLKGHSRKLARNVLRAQRLDVFRTRPSSLHSWLPWLNDRWEEATRNALALWREMKTNGFVGQSGVVYQWAQRRRLAEKANQSELARTTSARVIARLLSTARDDLAKSEAILVAAIEVNVPDFVIAGTVIGNFQSMIRSETARKLDEWLEAARSRLVESFAVGGEQDLDAVRNAIISPWSNGQTEVDVNARLEASTIPGSGVPAEQLSFAYSVSGSAGWRPTRVYSDGQKTYIQFPRSISGQDEPVLFVVSGGQNRIVNYRRKSSMMVLDHNIDRAVLVSGVGWKQRKVTIIRGER